MKTTIEMPDELFRKVKAVAALRGQSMKQWLTEIVAREIGEIPAEVGDRKTAADDFLRNLEALASKTGRHWQGAQDAVGALRGEREKQ